MSDLYKEAVAAGLRFAVTPDGELDVTGPDEAYDQFAPLIVDAVPEVVKVARETLRSCETCGAAPAAFGLGRPWRRERTRWFCASCRPGDRRDAVEVVPIGDPFGAAVEARLAALRDDAAAREAILPGVTWQETQAALARLWRSREAPKAATVDEACAALIFDRKPGGPIY